jgi:hypothetical protein
VNEDGEEVEAKRPAKSFKKMKKLEDIHPLFEKSVTSRDKASALAGLERIVQLLKEDKKLKIDDAIKVKLIGPTVTCLEWGEHNLAVLMIGCCALAVLSKSKSPYPRMIWDAATNSHAVIKLTALLDRVGETPGVADAAKAALTNLTKNNKELVAQAGEWLKVSS